MTSQLTLLLLCMLVSKVLSLTCYDCISSTPETCKEKTSCSDKCVSTTSVVYTAGKAPRPQYSKSCSRPDKEICQGYSLKTAGMNVKSNIKCCSTDLCNSETLPAPNKAPNGRVCYTCHEKNCSLQVECEADELYCFTVTDERQLDNMKGCASKSYCDMSKIIFDPASSTSHVECCQGNLCNSAEIFTLSFLFLIIIPLLSSIIFN